jgi:hypothetical protein
MTVTDRLQHAGGALPSSLTAAILNSTISITGDDLSGFPDGATGNFVVTLGRGASTEERVLCETRTGNVLTVASAGRGWDGTLARDHEAGTTVEHTWSTTEADQANAHSSSVAGHGVDVVVGTTETQTLSGKTLTAPTIVDFTNAAHDHGDADDGGNIPQASVTSLVSDLAAKAATSYVDTNKQDVSEKGQAGGYASLNGSTKVPIAEVPTGTSSSTVALGDHGHAVADVTADVSTDDTTGDTTTQTDGVPGPNVMNTVNVGGPGLSDGVYLIIGTIKGFTSGGNARVEVRISPSAIIGSPTLQTAEVVVSIDTTAIGGGATVFAIATVDASNYYQLALVTEKLSTGDNTTPSGVSQLTAIYLGA